MQLLSSISFIVILSNFYQCLFFFTICKRKHCKIYGNKVLLSNLIIGICFFCMSSIILPSPISNGRLVCSVSTTKRTYQKMKLNRALSECLSVPPLICTSARLFIRPVVCLSLCLSDWLPVRFFVNPSVCLSILLFFCLFVCPSV